MIVIETFRSLRKKFDLRDEAGRKRPAKKGLTEDHTAIDQQRLTGHIVRIRPSQERDTGGDIFRLRKATKGNAFGKLSGAVSRRLARSGRNLTVDLIPHRRFHNTGAVSVYRNAQRRQIARGGLRQAAYRKFTGAVNRQFRVTNMAGLR